MTLSHRSRYKDKLLGFGVEKTIVGSVTTATYPHIFSAKEYQWTVSDGHPWPPKKRKSKTARILARTLDIGGSFLTQSNTVEHSSPTVNADSDPSGKAYVRYTYDGPMFAHYGNVSAVAIVPASNAQLDAWGATGISRASPTNPLVGMGQWLGELRDLPKAPVAEWKRKAAEGLSLARNGSNAYLNVQFGWVPFLKDIRDFCKVAKEHDKRAAQFVQNSGKVIHRRMTIIDSTDTATTSYGPVYNEPVLVTSLYQERGSLIKNVTTKHHVWFSGAFTYYVDAGKTPLGKIRRAEQIYNHLYGLRISPHLLWQLAPWSWAVDWMSNVGDNIRNLSNFQNDGLVLKYGYIMETISIDTVYSLYGLQLKNCNPVHPRSTFSSITKSRRRATPFGFGLNPTSFTGRQWSIIAALGISRSPRSLIF